ncbi:SprB repeat-containing protein [Marinoscillum sp.]|uniref:SprB repeat-containing protein n=1 Tax=Marinoscillum sp. TaxID=2024838 RepID=UPI003BAA0BE7
MKNLRFRTLTIAALFAINACTTEQLEPSVDCSASNIALEVMETVDTGCGAALGSFTVQATGGMAPYTYSVGTVQSDGTFDNLNAGNYSAIATDANGCTGQIDVTITNLDGVNLETVEVTEAGCNSESGSIQITASGGVTPYSYSINDGEAQESNVFADLASGSHTVRVTDQLGCEVTETVDILSGISYEASVKEIIENSCAISGCHNGSVSPNFTSFSTIQNSADRIKTRTGNKSMPKGSTLSQSQIDLIACWVEDGAKNN